MAVSTKTIKRRIKSIGSTKKITKAMEMISAVKMRRAVANAIATRSYARLAWEMLTQIAEKTHDGVHPLLTERPVKNIGLILITSNRGLAGGFASRLLQKVHEFIESTDGGGEKVDVGTVIMLTGRQGKRIYHRFGHTVVAEFEKMDLTTRLEEILPMAQLALKEYVVGTYDKILVCYTDFVSPLQQAPKLRQILPFKPELRMPEDGRGPADATPAAPPMNGFGFKFEPNPAGVLRDLLPRLVEMQIYQAVLESDASEHSARMMAMRSASDAARDMIQELNYSYNKARQAAITQEISEIVGGAAAL